MPDKPEAKDLMDYWRQFSQGFIDADLLRKQLQDVIDTTNPEEVGADVQKVVHLLMGYFLGQKTVDDVDQELGLTGPETVQEVKMMGPKDVERKRDQLLDEMNQWPKGSPQHQQAMERLKALGYKQADSPLWYDASKWYVMIEYPGGMEAYPYSDEEEAGEAAQSLSSKAKYQGPQTQIFIIAPEEIKAAQEEAKKEPVMAFRKHQTSRFAMKLKLAMDQKDTVEVYWDNPAEEETEYEVDVEWSAGREAPRVSDPDAPGFSDPGDPGEVEIIQVREDGRVLEGDELNRLLEVNFEAAVWDALMAKSSRPREDY